MSVNSVRGKVVVITGGARGIDAATAAALHRHGAKVAIGDIDAAVVEETGAALGLPLAGTLDVTDPESFAGFLDRVENTLGPLDALVNNAGIMPAGKLIEESDALTRRMLDINVYGVILGSKLAAQRMVPRRSGHVINIASLAGQMPTAGLATYCATKHAVLGFTESAVLEYRGSGVQFSSVLPAFVNTELTAGTRATLGMQVEPEDIADAIVRLLAKPEPSVAVSRLAGLLVSSQKLLPRAVRQAVTEQLGMTRVFLDDVDVAARRAYEDRARGV
ncbi:MAG: short chain dehydrogenase [Nocardia sp.]|uniref:SDR family oxidoreductase n=1 Tax=Nocardia sp. TaxID=1821 RepID=UPI00262621C3|nr:SDR family oxidoreductase [Nocardia sp.]MCU1646257.1 short chain dehydrogenase [Nocardia sp.]